MDRPSWRAATAELSCRSRRPQLLGAVYPPAGTHKLLREPLDVTLASGETHSATLAPFDLLSPFSNRLNLLAAISG